MRALYSIALALVFAACSPQKRLNRLIDRNPSLRKTQLITVVDTVIYPAAQRDTVTHISALHDTVRLVTERLTVTVFQHRDSVYIHAHAPADTVVRVHNIETEKVIYRESDSLLHLARDCLMWLGVLGVLFLVFKLLTLIKPKP